jgi:hypothetical protein
MNGSSLFVNNFEAFVAARGGVTSITSHASKLK